MSQTRIYVVEQKDKPHRLIEATSAAQAIRHCARPEFTARAATPRDVATLMQPGQPLEKAFESNNGNNEQTNQTN
jgi:hypothetical protein